MRPARPAFALLLGLVLASPLFASAGTGPTCGLPTAGQAAWWRADFTAEDAYGCHHGTLRNGAGYAPTSNPPVTGALNLDGVNDYVEVPDAELWSLGSSDFTVSLRANFARVPSSSIWQPCCVFVGTSEGGGSQNKWAFFYGGGVLTFHVNSPATGPLHFAQTSFSPAIGEWYDLKAERIGGTYRISVNGLLQTAQSDGRAIPNANAPLTIGQIEGLGYFPGMLDEIKVTRG